MLRKRISVKPYPSIPKTPWKVDIPASIAGKRKRLFFASKEAAEVWARRKEDEFLEVGRKAFSDGLTFSEVVARFLPRVSESSKSHISGTKRLLKAFGDRFGSRAIETLGPIQIEDYLLEIQNKNTRASHYRHLRMLFRWAWRMELIPRNPMNAIDPPATSPKRNILTPDQMQAILKLTLPDWFWNIHILGAFAGLRASEIMELRHEDIDTERKQIHVRPGTQKGESWDERYVDFTDPFQKYYRPGTGAISPFKQVKLSTDRKTRIVKPLKWETWPEGCLRHSFATYHLAKYQDASKTAHQMGHKSISMVTRVYAQPAKGVVADEWWKL